MMGKRLHWIESWILKVGQRFFLFIGALAIVAILLGLAAVVCSGCYWLLGTPSKPMLPDEPQAPPPTTLDAARLQIRDDFRFDEKPGRQQLTVSKAALATVASLQELFPSSDYSWDDVYVDYCRIPSSYGCLEKGRKLERRGVGPFLAALVDLSTEENRPYLVGELTRLLTQAEVAERGSLAAPICFLSTERLRLQEKALSDWRETIMNLNSQYDRKRMTHTALSASILMGGVMGIVWGLGAVIGVCLMVAILAIERHLRSQATATNQDQTTEQTPS